MVRLEEMRERSTSDDVVRAGGPGQCARLPATSSLIVLLAMAMHGSAVARPMDAMHRAESVEGKDQQADPTKRGNEKELLLPKVEVRASELPGPGASPAIEREGLAAAPLGVDLPEVLVQLPGVVALERQNQVQDSPLVIRGFGARAAFGTRGVRIESDGVPFSFADGQGQLGGLQPANLSRVSLQSGPYAAVAGFNAGAVLRSESRLLIGGSARLAWQGDGGSSLFAGFGERLDRSAFGWSASHTRSRGARQYSKSERSALGGHWQGALAHGTVDLRLDAFDQPFAEDPGSLNAANLRANPQAADPLAVQLGAGKQVRQQLASATWHDDEARLALFLGRRDVIQVLPLSPGQQRDRPGVAGWIDLSRAFYGLRAQRNLVLDASEWRIFVDAEVQDDDRLGFENFSGEQLGVRGNLKRDERSRFRTYGAGLEASHRWFVGVGGSFHTDMGLRWNVQDALLGNVQLGTAQARAQDVRGWTGYGGLRWQPSEYQLWRLAWGRGLETPTATELANRPGSESGFNESLRAPRSDQWELRHERRHGAARFGVSAYVINTRDDLVVVENVAGRAVFGNAASTQRQGIEFDWVQKLPGRWHWRGVGQWAQARYQRDVRDCAGPLPGECQPGALRLRAGSSLPATPRLQWRGELMWRDRRQQFGAAWLQRDRIVVDDRRQVEAPSLGRLDLYYQRSLSAPSQDGARWSLRVQLEDALDRGGVAGIAINEASGRYFDPAPGRQLSLVVQWRSAAE